MSIAVNDNKQDVAHLEGTISNGPEKPANIVDDAAAKGQVLSGFEELGAIATIKKFRRAFLFCFMSAFSAACDGYQVSHSSINCVQLETDERLASMAMSLRIEASGSNSQRPPILTESPHSLHRC